MTVPLDDPVFLGRTVERLSTLIETQSEVIFKEHGVIIPVKSCSLMIQLARLEHATAADLAPFQREADAQGVPLDSYLEAWAGSITRKLRGSKHH